MDIERFIFEAHTQATSFFLLNKKINKKKTGLTNLYLLELLIILCSSTIKEGGGIL